MATRNYLFQFDATTWGWIHLLIGLLVAFAGWGLLSGGPGPGPRPSPGVLSAIANFLFIPYYLLVAAHHHPGHLRDLGRPPTVGTCASRSEPGGHPAWVSTTTWKPVSPGWEAKQVAVVALDDGCASRCPAPGRCPCRPAWW